MLPIKQNTETFWDSLKGIPVSFSFALEACKKGYLIKRPWSNTNAKYIKYVPEEIKDGNKIEHHFVMVFAKPVLHSRALEPDQEDLLANDWQILGKEDVC